MISPLPADLLKATNEDVLAQTRCEDCGGAGIDSMGRGKIHQIIAYFCTNTEFQSRRFGSAVFNFFKIRLKKMQKCELNESNTD